MSLYEFCEFGCKLLGLSFRLEGLLSGSRGHKSVLPPFGRSKGELSLGPRVERHAGETFRDREASSRRCRATTSLKLFLAQVSSKASRNIPGSTEASAQLVLKASD